MQSFASSLKQVIRQPVIQNMPKRLVSRWAEEATDKPTENNALLLANNRELQARLETMEQKLKVAELEMKLTRQEMMAQQKVTEPIGELQKEDVHRKKEEIRRKLSGQEEEAKMARYNRIISTELEKLAKHLDDNSTELRRKMVALYACQSGWDNNNGWRVSYGKHVKMSADGLTVTYSNTTGAGGPAGIRGKQPISREMLAYLPALKLAYWEGLVKKTNVLQIGWKTSIFPLDHKDSWGGHHTLECDGHPHSVSRYFDSDSTVEDYGKRFDEGVVVGSGLLLTQDDQLKLFFTLNGRLNGDPIVLKKDSHDQLFYPAVCLVLRDASIETNFGADPEKTFKFDINAHEAELFD